MSLLRTCVVALLILPRLEPAIPLRLELQAPSSLDKETATLYWGFFVRGPNQEKLPEDEAERLQKLHIASLEKLHSDGKLLMAGPLGDAGRLRGIVVLNVPSLDDVKACFKDDPYVKMGRMEMEAYKWITTRGDIKEPHLPVSMEEYRVGLIKKGSSWSSESTADSQKLQDGHMANIRKMAASGALALAGPLADAGELRGIFIFRTKDEREIKSMVAEDPAVQAGRLQVELYPLYLAAGVLGP